MGGLYALKPWFSKQLRAILRLAARRGWTPDAFTITGIVIALFAGAALALGWWGAALPLLIARLACANLDGALARERDVARPWGFVLNEIGDRASDVAMFAGWAVLVARQPDSVADAGATGGLDPLAWVLIAALAATLPTFASLAAAGAGAQRINGGPLGKVERAALVLLAAALVSTWPPITASVGIVIVLGSLLTAAGRLKRAHARLRAAAP